MKINFLKKEKCFTKENLTKDFDFFWKLFILFLCLFLCLALFVGYLFFMKINKEVILSNTIENKHNKIKKERFNKVLDYFLIRQQKSNQIIISPSPIIDPSL